MPCSAHDHKPWPRSGTHVLRIEACETRCGWCGHETKAANNLRAHARCHVKNPKNPSLSEVTIHTGKAGRSRVSMSPETTTDQQKDDDLETKLSSLEAKIQSLQADNDTLNVALQRARAENEKLRAAGTLTTISLLSSAANDEGFEEDCNRLQQKLLGRSAPSPRGRESFSSDSDSDHIVDLTIETVSRPMAEDQRPSVEPTITKASSQSERRPGDIHSGRDVLPPFVPGSTLSPASNPENGAKPVERSFNLTSYLPKLEPNFLEDFPFSGLGLDSQHGLFQNLEETHAKTPPQRPAVPAHGALSSVLHIQETNLTQRPCDIFPEPVNPMNYQDRRDVFEFFSELDWKFDWAITREEFLREQFPTEDNIK